MKTLVAGRLISWTAAGLGGMRLRSYAYRRGETVVWIDPAEPEARDQEAVSAFGTPDAIVLTFGAHDRDAAAIMARTGATLWLPGVEGGDRYFKDVPHEAYTWQSELPAGLRAVHIPGVGLGEHAICGDIDGKRFAFVGDSVLHIQPLPWVARLLLQQPKGRLQHKRFYGQWGGNKKQALKEAKRLMSLELEMLLPTHGEPILEDARGALRESMSAW